MNEGEERRYQFRLTRFDTQIRTEFDLIGHRMTWLMLSQAFLFVAFATAAATVASYLANAGAHSSNASNALLIPRCLLVAIPIIGIVTAICVKLSISAAKSVVDKLKDAREKVESVLQEVLDYDRVGISRHAKEHIWGNLPSEMLPWLFIGAWLFFLCLRLYVLFSR